MWHMIAAALTIVNILLALMIATVFISMVIVAKRNKMKGDEMKKTILIWWLNMKKVMRTYFICFLAMKGKKVSLCYVGHEKRCLCSIDRCNNRVKEVTPLITR